MRPAPVKLAPMTLAHIDDVLRIEQGSYAFPWTRGNFVDSLVGGHWARVLQDDAGSTVAYVVAMPGVDEMHLLNLTVASAWRRRGLGARLADELVAEARRRAARTIWLEVRPSNSEALQLYQRLGFEPRGQRRGYYPAAHGHREDAVVMALETSTMQGGNRA